MRSISGKPFDDLAGDAKRRVPIPLNRRRKANATHADFRSRTYPQIF